MRSISHTWRAGAVADTVKRFVIVFPTCMQASKQHPRSCRGKRQACAAPAPVPPVPTAGAGENLHVIRGSLMMRDPTAWVHVSCTHMSCFISLRGTSDVELRRL